MPLIHLKKLPVQRLYRRFADSLFHFEQIAQHFESVTNDAHLGFTVVDHVHGNLYDLHLHLHRPQDRLKVEGEAIDLATREDLLCRLGTECLASAL